MSISTDENRVGDNALITIYSRNDFYKRKFHVALVILALCLLGMAMLVGMLVYIKKHPPHPLYFVADPVGRLLQDIPTQAPNMTAQDVGNWAVEAVQAAYSYDFVNYRSELQEAQKYFTAYGWTNYMSGLSLSKNLTALTVRKYIITARVVDTPKLVREGVLGGSYAYKFSMPLFVTYWYPPFDDKSKFFNSLIVTVTVQRQNLLSSYKGLGVLQMVAEVPQAAPGVQTLTDVPGA